jgi:hypothetical protein
MQLLMWRLYHPLACRSAPFIFFRHGCAAFLHILPLLRAKKKLTEVSSIPMYYQCFNRLSVAHAICVVR